MPFSEFDTFSGRIRESSRLQPLYPLSPNPLDKTEPPKIMFDGKVQAIKARAQSTSANQGQEAELHPMFKRYLKKRALLQARPDLPMYLRLGLRDRVVFGAILFSMGYLSIDCARFAYECIKSK